MVRYSMRTCVGTSCECCRVWWYCASRWQRVRAMLNDLSCGRCGEISCTERHVWMRVSSGQRVSACMTSCQHSVVKWRRRCNYCGCITAHTVMQELGMGHFWNGERTRRTSCVFAAPLMMQFFVVCKLYGMSNAPPFHPGRSRSTALRANGVTRDECACTMVSQAPSVAATDVTAPIAKIALMWQVTDKFQPSTSVPSFCKTVWGIPRSLLWPSISWQPARATPPKRGHTRVPKNEI
jgi:hypothetical protein